MEQKLKSLCYRMAFLVWSFA